MAKRLMDGAVVMRCAARDCMGRSRAGTRSLLVSVDALDSLTRILGEVGYEEGYEPCILVREGTAGFESLAAHGEASRIVSALPSAAQQRCSALVGGDGRAHVHLVPEASDPFLYATLKSMSKVVGLAFSQAFASPKVTLARRAAWSRCGTSTLALMVYWSMTVFDGGRRHDGDAGPYAFTDGFGPRCVLWWGRFCARVARRL